MEQYQSIIELVALSAGVAWASGINLYAVLLVLGLGGSTGYIALPDPLLVLQNPAVIAAAGLMYMVEFTADKTPGVDSLWDGLHTFIRLPAGALLAAGALGEVDPAMLLAGAIVGGSISATSHTLKAGSRVLINTSPEPVSNWAASITEDVAVIGGLWLALNHPATFIILLVLFIAVCIWMLPKLWRAIKTLFTKIAQFFKRESPGTVQSTRQIVDREHIVLPNNNKP